MTTRRLLPGIVALALAGAGLSGCEEEVPRSVRLTIDANVAVPAQVDLITISLVAGNDLRTGNACIPEADPIRFQITGPADLPKIVDLLPGPSYAAWLGYDVTWWRDGGTHAVSHAVGRVPWPSSGATEITVALEAGCVDVGCAQDANCVDGDCFTMVGWPFDPAMRETGALDCELTRETP